jgi:Holliday junction resolvase RusA-like endonuclease
LLALTIYGNVPSKSNCYRVVALPDGKGGSRGSLAKRKELKAYERAFFQQVLLKHRRALSFPLCARFRVYYDSWRPDLDNAFKVVLDCLQSAGVIENDRLVRRIVAEKFKDAKNPRVEIELTEYLPQEEPLLFAPSLDEMTAWVEANAHDPMRRELLALIRAVPNDPR